MNVWPGSAFAAASASILGPATDEIDASDTMIVTFGEVPSGSRTGPVKRQYWARQGSQWKIFFEGTIG